jgi:predicted nucleic acid-binding protein
MVKALFDTNVLIDFLKGIPEAGIELDAWDSRAISLITWMEVMVGASDEPEELSAIGEFLARFEILQIDSSVAAEAVRIRKARQIKLPDSVIQATANVNKRIFVTRNIKDFSPSPDVRIPYGHPFSIEPSVWQSLRALGTLPGERASAVELAEFAEFVRRGGIPHG